MLIDVLTRFSADTGLHPIQKRDSILNYLQKGADQLHNELECTKIYREVTLVVQPDAVVSLPAFIGELRGMRMHTNELPFDLHSIGQPRYVSTTLGYKFKNWRDLGDSPVLQLPAQSSPLTLQCTAPELTPITVTINGQTTDALEIEEAVLMNVNSITTSHIFLQNGINTIGCMSNNRVYDVYISDSLNNIIAILYNNQRKTRYKILDVSQIFWTLDTSAGESLIDVLYKLPKVRFFRDSDSFYAGDDFDESWYDMAMHMYLKPLASRAQDAAMFLQSAMSACISAKDGSEMGILKKISFGRNKFYNLFKKFRYYPGSVTNVDHNVQS